MNMLRKFFVFDTMLPDCCMCQSGSMVVFLFRSTKAYQGLSKDKSYHGSVGCYRSNWIDQLIVWTKLYPKGLIKFGIPQKISLYQNYLT